MQKVSFNLKNQNIKYRKIFLRAKKFVNVNLKKGRGVNDLDVTIHLDEWLEMYEKDHEIFIDEEGFEEVCKKIIKSFYGKECIYKYENWESYYRLVRSKGLVSVQEQKMQKGIKKGIIYRDTEFKIDEFGKYKKP